MTARLKVWITVLSIVWAVAAATSHGQAVLARNGHSDYTNVIDPACSASDEHTAEELQRFLEQILTPHPPGHLETTARNQISYQ